MITSNQQHAILSRISTSRILALAADLEALDLQPGGRELDDACERLAARLRTAGAHQVELRSYPSGPEHHYFGWSQTRRSHTEEAELWLRTPAGQEELVCRSSDNPACSMGAHRSTAAEGELFEVVDVGYGTRPTDYRGQRMPGRLALATGHHFDAAMLEALASRQAEGLLCGPGSDVADPTLVVPNRLGDPSLFAPHRPFGFNLSAHQFNRLGNMLAAGTPVQVRVRVRTTMDSGAIPLVVATLEGGEQERDRVLLVSALGAAGSALGAACLVEILATLGGLVVDGALPPLRRSLQLVVAPEPIALVAWLDELGDAVQRARAALLLEIGEAGQAARIRLEPSPPVRPCFVSDLVGAHLGWAARARGAFRGDVPVELRSAPYGGDSPLLPLVDRELGIPAAALRCIGDGGGCGPLSHGPLHRLTAGACAAAFDLCALGDADVPRLLCNSQLRGQRRMVARAEALQRQIEAALHQDEPASRDGRHLLHLAGAGLAEGVRREGAVMRSCGAFLDGPGQHALPLAETVASLEEVGQQLQRALALKVAGAFGPRVKLVPRRAPLTALERRADSVRVVRHYRGPFPRETLLRDAAAADREWLVHNAGALSEQPLGDAVLQWVDGERTLLQVHECLALDRPGVDLKLLWRYLEAVASTGWIELVEIPRTAEA